MDRAQRPIPQSPSLITDASDRYSDDLLTVSSGRTEEHEAFADGRICQPLLQGALLASEDERRECLDDRHSFT